MDFSFTEEQSMLRDTVASFLGDKYDFEARWRGHLRMRGLGQAGLHNPRMPLAMTLCWISFEPP